VRLSPDLQSAVEDRLREFLLDAAPDPLGLRSVVERFGALPLTLDVGGCCALRFDGEIVSFAWDEPHGLAPVDDHRLGNAALYQGSLKYPELAPLVPARNLRGGGLSVVRWHRDALVRGEHGAERRLRLRRARMDSGWFRAQEAMIG
jgi:hypothetical protein